MTITPGSLPAPDCPLCGRTAVTLTPRHADTWISETPVEVFGVATTLIRPGGGELLDWTLNPCGHVLDASEWELYFNITQGPPRVEGTQRFQRRHDNPPTGPEPHVTELQRSEPLPAETVAQLFHEAYERLAPEHGYTTREATRVPWSDVPPSNRNLMTAVAGQVAPLIAAAELTHLATTVEQSCWSFPGNPCSSCRYTAETLHRRARELNPPPT